jgi:hypothetical protein
MKTLKIILVLLGAAFLANAQEGIVRASTKLNTNFEAYKTFAWSQSPSPNELIKNSIKQELVARGYQQTDVNPDLVISYQVLEKRTSVKGFVNDDPTVVAGEEVRQPQDTATFILEPGTLMISMADRKTSVVVWDGFASGLEQGTSYASDEKKVKDIVRQIFGQFKYRVTPMEN